MFDRSPLNLSVSLTMMSLVSFFLILLMGAFLIQVGINPKYIGLLMLAFIVATYLFCGIYSKTMKLPEYQTASGAAQTYHVGQSIAAGMISFGIFVALSSRIYETGSDGLATFSGWILGACLMVVLFASAINASGKPTLASLIQPKKEYWYYRLAALIVIVLTSVPLLILQFNVAGEISRVFFGWSHATTVSILSFSILFCLILGGIQGLTISRMIAYPVIAIAFLLPVALIALKLSGNPIPQLAYGTGALLPIDQINQEMLASGFLTDQKTSTITGSNSPDLLGYIATLVCLSCGLAAMPHLLQHFTTLKNQSRARGAGVWAIALLLVVITAVPAVAAFYQIDIYTSLLGLQVADISEEVPWLFSISGGSTLQAIAICGEYVTSQADVIDACANGSDYFITSRDVTINPDLLVLSSAILNELPSVITYLLVTGALVAIWTTADGLTLAIANTLCHDGYANVVEPQASQSRRLFVSRVFLFCVVVLFAILSVAYQPSSRILFEVTFALSAAAVFPALLTRIWFPNTRDVSIISGMLTGFLLTAFLLFFMIFGDDYIAGNGDELRLTFNPEQQAPSLMVAGLAGMIVAFVVIFITKIMHFIAMYRDTISKVKPNATSRPETV